MPPGSTICDPYLNLFRNIIPPIGGSLDLSPVLAFLTLNVFTNAAEALPAEHRDANENKQSVDALRGTSIFLSLLFWLVVFNQAVQECHPCEELVHCFQAFRHLLMLSNKYIRHVCVLPSRPAGMKLSVKQRVAMRREMKRLKQTV